MRPTFHNIKVSEVRRETDDTVSVAFEIPDELKVEYQFLAGQYLTLKTIIDGEEIRRSYSLCSSPLDREWRVAIKKITEGKFSTFANESLKPGDQIEVMVPTGGFHVEPKADHKKSYALFAAGSGITPIISIIKTILQEEPNSDVILFYGNKGFANIIFREEIEGLKNKYMNNLRVVHVLSRESLGNEIQKGRINSQKIEDLYNAFLKDTEINEVFVCGPEEMILNVKDFFTEKTNANVHFELFTTSESNKPKVVSNEPSIEANVKVIIDGDTLDVAMTSEGESILDAAYKVGGDLPFACKGGVCCTCKAKIIEGLARMDVNFALEPDEVEAGYILTCQAHPTSEKLTISFDD